jgi:hypothetical protein
VHILTLLSCPLPELATMLLEAFIETFAWASARPKHESAVAAQKIEKRLETIVETEKEQGMSDSLLYPFFGTLNIRLTFIR